MPNSRATARRLHPSTSTARRTRPYISTWNIPPVSHRPSPQGNGSRNEDPAVDYFYSAAEHRSRGVLWSIFAPALIAGVLYSRRERLLGRIGHGTRCEFAATRQAASSRYLLANWQDSRRRTRLSISRCEDMGA